MDNNFQNLIKITYLKEGLKKKKAMSDILGFFLKIFLGQGKHPEIYLDNFHFQTVLFQFQSSLLVYLLQMKYLNKKLLKH